MHSSSVHRLRLPLLNQSLAQCSENVIHVLCVRHDEPTSKIATSASATSHDHTTKITKTWAGTVVIYVEHSTVTKSERVPRRVSRRIDRRIEGNVRHSMC